MCTCVDTGKHMHTCEHMWVCASAHTCACAHCSLHHVTVSLKHKGDRHLLVPRDQISYLTNEFSLRVRSKLRYPEAS